MLDVRHLLQVSPPFAGLEAGLLDRLAEQAASRAYGRGERVWHAGEPARVFTVVRSGLVKIVREAPDGSDVIVALFGPREAIGSSAVLGKGEFPADAVACSERAEVVRVPAEPVLGALQSHALVGQAMVQSLIAHNRALQDKILIMSAGSVPKRLSTFLVTLAERFGDEMPDGTVQVPTALSRGEIASFIGTTLETVSRAMSAWQKQGRVATSEDGFTLRDLPWWRSVQRGEAS